MMRRGMATLVLLALGLALAVPAARGQGGTVSSSYMQTFDGMPTAPGPYRPPGWDVQVHSRDSPTWTDLEPMVAQHGPACEAPPATHELGGDYPSHVFQCHDHLMTAINAGGYGVIYLTPPALLDWSQSPATLQWDMSTLRTSSRDWIDVWLSPVADHLALPLDAWLPDLAGPPQQAVHVRLDTSQGGSIFRVETIAGGIATEVPSSWWVGYESVLTPDAARRDTFQIQVSRTHIKISMPAYNLVWADADIPDLGWDQGVVQFGHHSYNPRKDCGVPVLPAVQCDANTWHWDSVSISPSVPVSILPLSPRRLSDQAPGSWAWPIPAPGGSYLQFAANSAPGFVAWGGEQGAPGVDLSWDGGATWQTVRPQWSSAALTKDFNGARSYWVPLPAGATAVQVRGTGAYGQGAWQAKDASVWQLTAPDVPTPLPTPSPLPTVPPDVTATIPPTVAPTATEPPTPPPTDAPATLTLLPATRTPLATPLPTSTALPVATATPLPGGGYPMPDPMRPCQVAHAAFGTPVATPWVNAPTSQCR